jgi:anti-sigma B factor antagonist
VSAPKVAMKVRKANDIVSIVDIQGEVTAAAENTLMDAHTQASGNNARAIILNFSGLEFMNSAGISLLVTFATRANRQKQRLMVYGLNDHYKQVFGLTRLNEGVSIFDSEKEALVAASA